MPRKVAPMKMKMLSKSFRRRKNTQLQVSADSIVAIDTFEKFEESKKELEAQIESREDTLHYGNELYEILSGADYETENKKVKKDQQGRPIPKAFSIIDQRIINRVLDLLEESSKDNLESEFEIDAKPADMVYAANRVEFFYENFVAQTTSARMDFFDYMMDAKGKAQAEIDKKK